MKKTIFILFLLIIVLGCKDKPDEIKVDYRQLNKGKLTGIWQDYPVMAAGWSDNYQFFPNKTFKRGIWGQIFIRDILHECTVRG